MVGGVLHISMQPYDFQWTEHDKDGDVEIQYKGPFSFDLPMNLIQLDLCDPQPVLQLPLAGANSPIETYEGKGKSFQNMFFGQPKRRAGAAASTCFFQRQPIQFLGGQRSGGAIVAGLSGRPHSGASYLFALVDRFAVERIRKQHVCFFCQQRSGGAIVAGLSGRPHPGAAYLFGCVEQLFAGFRGSLYPLSGGESKNRGSFARYRLGAERRRSSHNGRGPPGFQGFAEQQQSFSTGKQFRRPFAVERKRRRARQQRQRTAQGA